MNRLAIVDLDGCVANVDARFARAEEAKQAWLNDLQNVLRSEKQAIDIYWRTVFSPDLVSLDTLIDGAKEGLEAIRHEKGYQLILMTSRPETMREATCE